MAQLLRLGRIPAAQGLRYDLSIYSGGIGVLDKLAIAIALERQVIRSVVAALKARTPAEAVGTDGWAEEFRRLVQSDHDTVPMQDASARFINQERLEFQPSCLPAHEIWFAELSDVNDWTALWLAEGVLNYLAFSQG